MALKLGTGIGLPALPMRYRLLSGSISIAISVPVLVVVIVQGRDAPMGWWYAFFAAVVFAGAAGEVVARAVWRLRT